MIFKDLEAPFLYVKRFTVVGAAADRTAICRYANPFDLATLTEGQSRLFRRLIGASGRLPDIAARMDD
jgi:hypothetical protein